MLNIVLTAILISVLACWVMAERDNSRLRRDLADSQATIDSLRRQNTIMRARLDQIEHEAETRVPLGDPWQTWAEGE